MPSVCDACAKKDHPNCDPIGFWCGCPCWTGELLDPLRIPEQPDQGEP